MKSQNTKQYIYLFLICFIINLLFTASNLGPFEMKSKITDSELDILNIENKNINDQCGNWIPSLFSPIMLVLSEFKYGDKVVIDSKIKSEIFSDEDISICLFNFTFLNEYNICFGREKYEHAIHNCYFGLMKKYNFNDISEGQIILNNLKVDNKIDQKIFSFGIWDLGLSEIKSTFFLGYVHQNFTSKNGVIGTCKAIKDDIHWGCSFNKISFNNIVVDLKDENGNLYNIYFSSENYNIKFPKKFEEKFNELTNNSCIYDTDLQGVLSNLTCRNFFNEKNFASITLIDDNMKITIQIDSIIRFSNKNETEKDKTRIQYQDINYFIFPLIMFKNFQIQFDADNDIISFYTTDKSILQLNQKTEEESSSNGLKIFLIILIILIIIALLFGIFIFLRKRIGSVQKSINKYNKFEDEDSFQNMNEKRVF